MSLVWNALQGFMLPAQVHVGVVYALVGSTKKTVDKCLAAFAHLANGALKDHVIALFADQGKMKEGLDQIQTATAALEVQ